MSQKDQYWNEFIKNKNYWPSGFSIKRLEKVKPIVWKDKFFWSDILQRHGGNNVSLEEMKNNNYELYQHCIGNMAGLIREIMYLEGILKNE